MRPTRDDAADAIALVQAVRRGDERAIETVLTSAKIAAMARALATVLPRAVRTQGSTVDEFLHGLTDSVVGDPPARSSTDRPARLAPVPDLLTVCPAVAEHLRTLLAAIEAGELAAEHWQLAWLAGAISALATAGGGVSNRTH